MSAIDVNFDLTPDQVRLREETHRFAVEVMRPVAMELDGMAPEGVVDDFFQAGCPKFASQIIPSSNISPYDAFRAPCLPGVGTFARGLGGVLKPPLSSSCCT